MKKIYFLITCFYTICGTSQVIDFPDPALKAKLLVANAYDQGGNLIDIDSNSNGEIEQAEALVVFDLTLDAGEIINLSGLEYFINLERLSIYDNPLANIDVSYLENLRDFNCHFSQVITLALNDGLENLAITSCELPTLNISNCLNLKTLNCSYNELTSLDVSSNTQLNSINCRYNHITSLDVTSLTALETLDCSFNEIANLTIGDAVNLRNLQCELNQLESLNISNLQLLEDLVCSNNQISTLDVTGKIHLRNLRCSSNLLTSIDLTGVGDNVPDDFLTIIDFESNNFQSLDFTVMGQKRIHAKCGYNPQLTTISMKNGFQMTDTFGNGFETDFVPPPLPECGLFFAGCPNIIYICTDEYNIPYVQARITAYGYQNCVTNSYCSFVPGEDYFEIAGIATFDLENNGCNVGDASFSGLELKISDGTAERTFFTGLSGNYFIAALAGNHTLTPVVDTNLFTVTPPTAAFTFPVDGTPIDQQFCIAPNGVHPDMEAIIFPITAARPGFDVTYKIICRNKGNQPASGMITFGFEEPVMDFLFASPAASAVADGTVSWTFESVMPYQSVDLLVTFNLNSPVDTPPLNGNDVLDLTAIVDSGQDDSPQDNTDTLSQTVVNSFDPNDKTCLEGAIVPVEIIGKEVHYLIRFENIGTAPAENIVVKDVIDESKFDVESLTPITASHPFETRVSEGNKIEFVFEGIGLPFEAGSNEGYIGFKIKTLETLAAGDTFTNTASIFFDYNFPIITNTASTTIQMLGTGDHDTADFAVYPNPVKDILNLVSDYEMIDIAVYNILGQRINLKQQVNDLQVDVSGLNTGSYFFTAVTANGSSTVQFIKE